jgi:hypothetical protein
LLSHEEMLAIVQDKEHVISDLILEDVMKGVRNTENEFKYEEIVQGFI